MDSIQELKKTLNNLKGMTTELKNVSENAFKDIPLAVLDQMTDKERKLIADAQNAFKLTGSIQNKADQLLNTLKKHG